MNKIVKREPYERQFIALLIKGAKNVIEQRKELSKPQVEINSKKAQ